MDVINLTAEPLGKLYSWLPHDLQAETAVFLPDACPGRSPLPTGTAVKTSQPDWRKFAVSDCGCGMRLVRSSMDAEDLTQANWNALARHLQDNKGGLGDLGGGNHFVDALVPAEGGPVYLLVHTGSRQESGHVDDLTDKPAAFDQTFDRVVRWAVQNRAAIHELAEEILGPLEFILDLPHNTYERVEDGAIIRKGSVHVQPGDLTILPSHLDGDVVLLRATDRVSEVLNSLSHGTGRAMSRSEAKPLARIYDFDALRERVLIPDIVSNASLRTDGPFAYRDLEPALDLIAPYVEKVGRFRVTGYIGHL